VTITLPVLGAVIELGVILAWIVFWAAVAFIAYRLHGAAEEHESRWRQR
jgi:hypothetical protein